MRPLKNTASKTHLKMKTLEEGHEEKQADRKMQGEIRGLYIL